MSPHLGPVYSNAVSLLLFKFIIALSFLYSAKCLCPFLDYLDITLYLFLLSSSLISSSPSSPLTIANDVTGNPATQGYPVRDKGIIVLSQLGIFAPSISLGNGH